MLNFLMEVWGERKIEIYNAKNFGREPEKNFIMLLMDFKIY